jgi:phosphoglycerate dehydrogenase-like enzyme
MMNAKKTIHAALLSSVDCPYIDRILDMPRRERIAKAAQLLPLVLTPENLAQNRKNTAQTEVLFTTWDSPFHLVTPDQFPALQIIFYAAGSIKPFGRPLLERGIQIVAARAPNADCVAQFCLGQITLSCKGYFRNTRACRQPATAKSGVAFAGAGLYGEKIALLGMGAVARKLVLLLRPFQLQVLAVDPYLAPAEAEKLGVKIVTMEQAFAEAYVVSNHLPNLPKLRGVLNRPLFASMRRDATFMNTGRGAQVNEADLIEVFRSRPDLTALLDVTDPEPPVPASPFYELPNVQLSSHLAGAVNDDLHRLGDCVIEEFERYCAGQPFLYAEKLESLDRMA